MLKVIYRHLFSKKVFKSLLVLLLACTTLFGLVKVNPATPTLGFPRIHLMFSPFAVATTDYTSLSGEKSVSIPADADNVQWTIAHIVVAILFAIYLCGANMPNLMRRAGVGGIVRYVAPG